MDNLAHVTSPESTELHESAIREQGVCRSFACDIGCSVNAYSETVTYYSPDRHGKVWKISYDFCKRLFDVAASVFLIITLLPLMVVVSLLVFLQDFGPVLYKSVRTGKNGVPFTMLKFRTMVAGSDELREFVRVRQGIKDVAAKLEHDPRVTKLGVFLRKTSIDELPQLFNILAGQMSFVGPRPFVVMEAAYCTKRQFARHDVKPGLTCFWQIEGRSEIRDFNARIEMDLRYLRTRSFLTDMKILVKTIPAVFSCKGAF